jgi:hypothetical protein
MNDEHAQGTLVHIDHRRGVRLRRFHGEAKRGKSRPIRQNRR